MAKPKPTQAPAGYALWVDGATTKDLKNSIEINDRDLAQLYIYINEYVMRALRLRVVVGLEQCCKKEAAPNTNANNSVDLRTTRHTRRANMSLEFFALA